MSDDDKLAEAREILRDELPLIPQKRVAELLGVRTRTLRRWIALGRLRRARTTASGSGRSLIPKDDLIRMLAEMLEPAPSFED